MLHGNLLLHGWQLSDVSFYPTELPQYLLIEAVRGLAPGVVHIAAAMSYTLLVLLTGLLAKGRATGLPGIASVLIAAGIVVAPQLGAPATTLLLSPDHTGTTVPLLAIWLVIDRVRPRWYVPAAVALLLAWVQVADTYALIVAVAPLAVAGLARAVCRLSRSRDGSEQARAGRTRSWYELSLAGAAVASVGIARLASALLTANGGYVVRRLTFTFAHRGTLPGHATLTWHAILALFGARITPRQPGIAAFFAVIHLAGVLLAAIAVLVAIARFFRRDDLVVPALAAAIVANLAAFVFSTAATDILSAREIVAVLPFGAVLAGRLLGPPLAHAATRIRIAAALAGAALGIGYLAALGYGAAQPPVPAMDADLAAWLAHHHLRGGLATYWNANSTTLDSGGSIAVRAVTVRDGRLLPRTSWEALASWYDPATQHANFVVAARAPRISVQRLLAKARGTFGPPARVYHFGRYTVLVWDKNLLAGFAP